MKLSKYIAVVLAAKGAFALFILTALAMTIYGCARYPELPTKPSGINRLTVRFEVAEGLKPEAYYFLAFDDDDDSLDGPLPAVVKPFGNGWGTGSFTRFIEIHLGRATLYEVNPNDPYQPVLIGYPIEFELSANTASITIDMDTFFTKGIPNTVDFNIIAVDEIILNPDYQGIRSYDALGPRGNDYVTMSLRSTAEYRNGHGFVIREISGDAVPVDADHLDIVDWSMRVVRGR
ncbi:MAG: hypothetical protein RMK18_07905 [Armatimonadota bacterium]|nr:hypothetical protein [Armatimonadota bacterium]MCX7778423.1 hypothetical protein [Armatimonadota bacterium]MDW8025768.1 hypothetical protein [Armatimonadota bacterium]